MSARNKQLLADKKALLIQNKKDYERLVREKEVAIRQLTEQMDSASKENKEKLEEREGELEKLKGELVVLKTTHEEEIKVAFLELCALIWFYTLIKFVLRL